MSYIMKLYTIVYKEKDNETNQRVCFVKAYGEKEALEKAEHNSLISWFNVKFISKREILK